jgi:hypothetical protein
MLSFSQFCVLAVLVVAVATADHGVRRKRQLITIDLEDNVASILRDLKDSEKRSSGKKSGGKKGASEGGGKQKGNGKKGKGSPKGDGDDGLYPDMSMSFTFNPKEGKSKGKGKSPKGDGTYSDMSMSFTFSPNSAPYSIPTSTPTANTAPVPEPTSTPTANTAPVPEPTSTPTANITSVPEPTPAPGTLTPAPAGGDCSVGVDKKTYLLETLSSITDKALLLDPLTPQGKAFAWMVDDDTSIDVCTYTTLDQRYAMATFYFATSGPGWALNTGWLTSENECLWVLATCDSDNMLTGLDMCKLSTLMSHSFFSTIV